MITEHDTNAPKPFHTTSDFWDCECDDNYIHSSLQQECKWCGVLQKDAPESRVEEIVQLLKLED